jgi:hypothetical protein
MNQETISDALVDPNPTDNAECSLTISCHDWQTVDGDAIMWEMVPLYDKQVKWSIVCKVMKDLELHNTTVVYVGSRAKCEKWSEIFLSQGLMTEVETL